jgi:transposase
MVIKMKPYSHDLRVRIYNYSLTHSVRETAKTFMVSPNTVQLLKKLHNETGCLEPRKSSFEPSRLISPEDEWYIVLLLSEKMDITLEELQRRYEEERGIHVSLGTLFNLLKRLNITRKKKTFYDPKKNTPEAQLEKELYKQNLEAIPEEKRFYADETGCYLNMTPLYGRSFCGKRAHDEKPTCRGETVNTVSILSEDGLKAEFHYKQALTAELFIVYLIIFVLPIMKDNQTLILDRHPAHCAKIVKNFLKQNNIKYLYLPPYSPELNPIEEAFSKVKQYIKKQKARTVDTLIEAINNGINTVTRNDITGYIKHAYEFLMV